MRFFKPESPRGNLFRDLAIVIFSVIIAALLVKTGVLENLLANTKDFKIFGSFIAGIFFTSIFTVAPATVVLGEIARANSLLVTVFLGGLGAALGDLLIFRFVKNSLVEDFASLVKKSGFKRLPAIFRLKSFRWFLAFLGALVIASPLPDELGLAMMGLSKMKISVFIPLSFLLNSLGILIIGLIARSLS
jgi:hypothetical protein